MTDPTTDAAREALVRVFDAANISARPLTLNDLAEALGLREYSHRGLADTYAAAVSRARDEYHAERLRTAVEAEKWEMPRRRMSDDDTSIHQREQEAMAHNDALDALLARMDGAK